VSDFGDWDDDDSFDGGNHPIDVEQLRFKLRRLREELGDRHEEVDERLVNWLRRQGLAR
jgi:hypothetical protein